MKGLGFNILPTQKSYEGDWSLRQFMTSRQSAFFFLNSDPMMQNILEIDPLLLDSVFIGL